jgi:hypothetical protein
MGLLDDLADEARRARDDARRIRCESRQARERHKVALLYSEVVLAEARRLKRGRGRPPRVLHRVSSGQPGDVPSDSAERTM